jgi:23S rRNA (adenine2503-C2)-methyltransferase
MIPVSALLPDELVDSLRVKPAFRGRQIFAWIHNRLVFDFADMSDLPERLRRDLAERALPIGLRLAERLRDSDGAIKFRFALLDGNGIEAVNLRDERGRSTACLSTQVGCGMGCRFCRTGALGYIRDLRADEIVDQFLLLRSFLHGESLSSLVFMGMGEPLANLDNLNKAVDVLSNPEGSGFSPRRMTVSTCGLVEGIHSLQERKLPVRLAVSLVSADSEVRTRLMPVARSNPLPELRRALLDYQAAKGKRVTLEIVLMAGINDRPEDVEALVRFVRGEPSQRPLKVLINLIPWNPLPDLPYQKPEAKRIEWFQRRIKQTGIPVTTRLSRGSTVCGACGQLGWPQEGGQLG